MEFDAIDVIKLSIYSENQDKSQFDVGADHF